MGAYFRNTLLLRHYPGLKTSSLGIMGKKPKKKRLGFRK
jgi:hypothetical protein